MDLQLARLLSALEARVGDDYLLAVTADHGMPPEPPSSDRRHFVPDIVDLLHRRFDRQARKLVTSFDPENCQMFVDEGRLAELGLTLRELAAFLESQPFIFAAFTNDDAFRARASRPTNPK
jgi:predicted AlkP superfamily pyrophosphatase or phosphodiesterase